MNIDFKKSRITIVFNNYQLFWQFSINIFVSIIDFYRFLDRPIHKSFWLTFLSWFCRSAWYWSPRLSPSKRRRSRSVAWLAWVIMDLVDSVVLVDMVLAVLVDMRVVTALPLPSRRRPSLFPSRSRTQFPSIAPTPLRYELISLIFDYGIETNNNNKSFTYKFDHLDYVI